MSRTLVGTVTSDKGDKTIVITVHTRKTHPIYKKQYSVTQKIMAHDEKNSAKLGDKVEITVPAGTIPFQVIEISI